MRGCWRRTFNTMTDSIARFQREAAQRERLSSLGRLSTVVAHEIRNPLMIIRTALRQLKQGTRPAGGLRKAAVTDIDEEVTAAEPDRVGGPRLRAADQIRPGTGGPQRALSKMRCARLRTRGAGRAELRSTSIASLPPIVTDGERLRLALVNILTNARHAVLAHPGAAAAPTPGIVSRPPACRVDGSRSRCAIGASALPRKTSARVFDPYFTTRRTGTGLGLAISRNIIEGLGGTIVVSSRAGQGTEVRIELPDTAARPG